jgi:CheY-like chemotaxis protein
MIGGEKHVLVVDDNEAVRETIVNMLQEYHYRVSTTSDGSEIRNFLETGDMIAGVILDALMPGESAPSLLLHLREKNLFDHTSFGAPSTRRLPAGGSRRTANAYHHDKSALGRFC